MGSWFWYFVIYSFFGFLLEVLFARAIRNPKRDRKCFYFLPLCPVYGLGALFIVALPPFVQANPLLLALGGALAATAAEFGMGVFYEKVLKVQFWDYSHLPLNIGGQVCLLFSVFWCGLGLALVYWVHPAVTLWVSHIPTFLTLPSALFLLLDAGFAVYVLRRDRTTDALLWYRHVLRGAEVRE